MNSKLLQTKAKLILLGYLDNEWLIKYLELLEQNFTTKQDNKNTQKHHAIPVTEYWTSTQPYNRLEALKLARKDSVNFVVNLTYADYLLAHAYLTLCTNLTLVQEKYQQQADLRKQNSQKGMSSWKQKYCKK